MVIAAIGILAAIVLVAINPTKQIESARSAQRRSEINSITKAIQQYSIDNNGQYPTGIEAGAKVICNTGSQKSTDTLSPTTLCDNKANLSVLVPTYIASIPQSDSNNYYVRRSNNSIEVSHPRDTIWNIGGTPSLDLNFAKNKSLIDGVSGNNLIDFKRDPIAGVVDTDGSEAGDLPISGRGATYFDSDRVMRYASASAPRFDHNPTTGESLGLLVEEQRTNLIVSSELPPRQNGVRMTYATGPSIVRPDGTTGTVNQLTTDTFGSDSLTRFTNNVAGGTANTTYAGSMWIRTSSGTADINIKVNDANLSYAAGNFYTATTSWQRITTTGSSNSTNLFIDLTTGPALPAGTVFYIWGAQLEAGAFPTSYIPTTTAAVTRAADLLTIGSSSLWFNPLAFTVIADVQGSPATTTTTNSGTGFPYVFSFHGTGRLVGSRSAGSNNGSWAIYTEPPNTFSYNTNANFNSVRNHKVAAAYDALSWQPAADGVMGGAVAPGVNPSLLTTFAIGSGVDGGFWNGTIKRFTYWPTRLSNTTLQSLTQ